jgi:flagellar basal-body rod protein FlgC
MALEDIFNVAGSALNAQTTRMNTTASNLANAATVAGSEDGAFRAKRAVFKSILADQMGDANAGGIKVEKLIDDPHSKNVRAW